MFRESTHEQTKTKPNSKRIVLLESMIRVNLKPRAKRIKAIINATIVS